MEDRAEKIGIIFEYIVDNQNTIIVAGGKEKSC